jgi:hypothetical protein
MKIFSACSGKGRTHRATGHGWPDLGLMLSCAAELQEAACPAGEFMRFLSARPAIYQRLDASIPRISPSNLESRMDFIYVALGVAFWWAIALMARGCDALQGRPS